LTVAHEGHVFSINVALLTLTGLAIRAPHLPQNFWLTALSAWHEGQATSGSAGTLSGAVDGAAMAAGSSCTALRNSRMLLPTAPPTVDSRLAPKTITRMIRMMRIPQGFSNIDMSGFPFSLWAEG
jgi:hypothetical protein